MPEPVRGEHGLGGVVVGGWRSSEAGRKSLRRHRHLILNWFRAKGTISSGVVEGLNGVVKLTIRKAFGFRTAKGIEIAVQARGA